MTITIADGRGALWQWDTGRRLRVGSGVEQIHYQNRALGGSVDVDVGDDGTAIIPDELLQDCHTLTAYAYVTDDTGAYTMVQQDFAVRRRARPSDYVYTPTDHAGFDRLRAEIGDLADLTTEAKTNLVAAINEAARTGGGAGSMDLRVADGYIQYSTDGGSTWQNLSAVAAAPGLAKEIAANTAARHTHANKAALDGITAGRAAAWDAKANKTSATQDAAGLMSAADKAKLDGIERGANKTAVPTALKNPNALTIKLGSTTVTYDGSAAKTVEIADGTEVTY